MADNILTESYDFVQKAVGEFVRLVENLADSLADDEIRKLILADLGLNPESGAQLDIPTQNMDSIKAYLDRTDADVLAFVTVMDDVHQVSEAIISFVEVASAEPQTKDALRELAFELFMLASLLKYRYQHPVLFGIGEVLGVIDYGLGNYDLVRLLWDQVLRFFDTVVTGETALLNGLYEWKLPEAVLFASEKDARDLSDLIFLIPAGILTYAFLREEQKGRFNLDLLYGWDHLDPTAPTPEEILSDRILSANLTAKFKGTGEKLFSLGLEHIANLDNHVVSDALRADFEANGKTLSPQAQVIVNQAGSKWVIEDEQRYTIKKEDEALNVYGQPVQSEFSTSLGIVLVPVDDGGPGVFLGLGAGGEVTIPLTTDWSLQFKGKASTAASLFINFADLGASQVFGPTEAGITLAFKKKDNLPLRRAQLPDIVGTNLSFGSFEHAVELSTQAFEVRTLTKNNTLVISGKSADNFIRKSLPAEEIRADFDLGVKFSFTEGKFSFTDGTRLKVVLPIGKEVLGVRFVYITLDISVRTDDGGTHVPIEISGSLSIKWGPFISAIDRIGLLVTLPPPKDEAGDSDWSEAFTFKPPTGVGFAINAPSFFGGGFLFFDRENQEYAGVIQLAIAQQFLLKAIGLITTRLPDGQEGFSILVIASVEFSPPGYQLIWGFTLQGVGLLVGVNRSMVLTVLQSGVRNGTLDAILFPKDPVRNAPKIISDLRSVFPATADRHVFGLLLFISWAGQKNSVDLKLGVILEVPAPVKLVILGQLKITLPTKSAGIVVIQCDIVGIWDQAAQSISVDAALRDSKVGEFPMTGEMALRSSWGRDKVFIFAIGGVHPAFNPPATLPSLKRVQIAIGTGDNPRLRLLGYLAITSNTFQVGARAELHATRSGFTLDGWAGIDALFQFDPFKVVVDFSAGVEIKRGSSVLFSLTLKATFEGFTPIHIHGKVKFKIFFISFSIPVDLTIGETEEALQSAVDVLGELVAALKDSNNWAGELTGRRDMLVSLREAPPSSELMVHPLGALSVRQQVVPLGVEIQTYKNAPPISDRRFEIFSVHVNGTNAGKTDVNDFFAPAQFFDLADDEKLTRPSFEEMPAGVLVGNETFNHGTAIPSELIYETFLIDRGQDRLIPADRYDLRQELFEAAALYGAASLAPGQNSGPGKYRQPGLGIHLSQPAYAVAGIDDLAQAAEISEFRTYTQTLAALQAHQATHPEDRGRFQVVGSHETVTP